MNILSKICIGSHLYGTNVPTSDHNYKGVFLPSMESLVLGSLGNCQKSVNLNTSTDNIKNTKDDIDYELYSLQHFLKLAQEGQTIAIEMLFAQTCFWEIRSSEWEWLHDNRHKFLCKDMRSFFGYCRTQATKYSVKGTRLMTIESALERLKFFPYHKCLRDIWDDLPDLMYTSKYVEPINNARMWVICGRKFHDTACVQYVSENLMKIKEGYGQRAFAAKTNEGIDWKAVSHAFRVGYELKEILETGDLHFPLRDVEFLRDLKLGKYDFAKDNLDGRLDELLSGLEKMAEKSPLPDKVDMRFAKEWLVGLYK